MNSVLTTFVVRLRGFRLDTAAFSGQLIMTTVTNLGMAGLALASGSLIARALGPKGRGELAAIQTLPAFIGVLAALGLPDAVVYFSSKSRDKTARFLTSAIALLLLSAIPFGVAGYLLMPIFLAAQSPEIIAVSRVYLVAYLPLMATQGMLLHPLRGRRDFVPWNLLRILSSGGWLAVVALGLILAPGSPRWFAFGYLFLLLAMVAPAALVLWRRIPGHFTVEWRLWRPMLAYGLPIAASALPQAMNLRLDQLLMAAMLPPDRLGYYVVAVAWSGALAPFLNGISAVLFPRVALETVGIGQTESLARGTRLTVLAAIGLSLVLFALTPPAVGFLFGRQFSEAIPAALILVVAGAISGINNVLGAGLRGIGLTSAILWGEIGGVFVTIFALALLLRPFGIVGAAASSLLGYSMTAILLLVHLIRNTGNTLSYFVFPRWADVRVASQQLRRMSYRE